MQLTKAELVITHKTKKKKEITKKKEANLQS